MDANGRPGTTPFSRENGVLDLPSGASRAAVKVSAAMSMPTYGWYAVLVFVIAPLACWLRRSWPLGWCRSALVMRGRCHSRRSRLLLSHGGGPST